ncbi:MAG: type VI secretion system baseplate subunit TssG [Mariniblastus sp.]
MLNNASRFEFFEAARLLSIIGGPDAFKALEQDDDGNSAAPKENEAGFSNDELSLKSDEPKKKRPAHHNTKSLRVRFRSSATKNFPAGEVQKLEKEGDRVELFTNVIGLFGPTGVLPHADKDLVAGGSPSVLFRDFLDIFNTRIIKLFYEAWKANRQDIMLEMYQRKLANREDSCTMMLLSVCGYGLSQTRDQHLFPDEVFAASAGLLSRNVRPASGIRRCIANQFNVPVSIKEFVEERLFLPREIQTRISLDGTGHNVLGKTAILGGAVPAHRQRFEVELGPLNRYEFELLCPFDSSLARREEQTAEETGSLDVRETGKQRDNIAFRRLVDLINSTLGRPLDFDIRFKVLPEAISAAQLGKTRLGFDSWVISKPAKTTRDDTVKRFAWDMANN